MVGDGQMVKEQLTIETFQITERLEEKKRIKVGPICMGGPPKCPVGQLLFTVSVLLINQL